VKQPGGFLAKAIYYIVLFEKQGGLSLSEILIPKGDDFRMLLRRIKPQPPHK